MPEPGQATLVVKATLECLGSQLWDEQHCSQSAPSSSAGAQSSCRPGPAPLGLAGCSQEAETEGRDALEQLGAEEPGLLQGNGTLHPILSSASHAALGGLGWALPS